jgi:diguanylate cyclase (GGDEF)-like protein/PAS domain S-box-containing protein
MNNADARIRALADTAFTVRVPGDLLVTREEGRLRAQLDALLEATEARRDGLGVGLWLHLSSEERFVVRDGGTGVDLRPWCSIPVRASSGATFGALTVSVQGERDVAAEDRAAVETVAWMVGLLLESAEAIEYRSLLDRVQAVIYIADTGAHGRWHYVSAQIEDVLGFTAEEWSADPTLWERRLHPDDRERVLATEPDEEFGAWGDPTVQEYRMLHRDGHTVWVRDDAVVIHDELGRGRWHGVLLDITDRKQAEAEIERRAGQHAAVARLGEHALERLSIGELMQEAVGMLEELLEVDGAAVAELLGDGSTLKLRASAGVAAGAIEMATRGPHAPAATTVQSGEPVVIRDWQSEPCSPGGRSAPRPDDQDKATREACARTTLTVLIGDPDNPYGVVCAWSLEPRDYSSGDIDFVQSIANVLADAVQRKSTEDAMQHRALHDPLTGLPNRVLFLDRLEQTLERLRRSPDTGAAVLFIDLDNFKLVNDSLGHHTGDELLAAVGTRLKQAVRPTDTVARFGGDEFGLLMEELTSERGAIAMAERISAVLARPFALDAGEHFVTTSIGIALTQGGEAAADLIRAADAAMYRAKERGRARYELYDEVMRGRAMARLTIENDLRRALQRNQLKLVYQPVVSLRDQAVVGAEALLRWDHPERGQILPDEFIPIAEDSGLIERIGDWALDAACRQAAIWERAAPAAPIGISVNLSPLQLTQRASVERVDRVLHRTGLDPGLLSLELTESLLVSKSDAIAEVLRSLKALGVRLVLDDFGTGYSSLGYLTRLPIDALKIDGAFVRALGSGRADAAITEAIIAMARALSLDLVGEGTETLAQVRELQRLGCQLAQGYYFSKPLTPAEMADVIEHNSRRAPARSAALLWGVRSLERAV